MPKRMLINATEREESRVAVLDEKGQIENLIVESAAKGQIKGNIYKAVIVNVDPGLEAAFIDYGGNRHGFLPLSDVHPKYYNSEHELAPSKIHEQLKKGAELLVQAEREEVMHKGAVFTTYISLPGRFMVIMPESSGGGISRKIENENDRRFLREALKLLKEDNDDIAIIIRTAGVGHDDQSLKDDYQNLLKDYSNILAGFKRKKGTGLIFEDLDLTIRSIRDYFSKDINEVYIDNYQVYKKSLEFFRRFMPEHLNCVKHYRDKRPLFSRFNVEVQIEQMYERIVPLPSGGSICIDPTEAMISIDVNSGSAKSEEGQEMLAFQTNVEAAVELARQLRLRNLGGLIVIDFIDMSNHKHRRIVEQVMHTVIKKDKARIEISPIGKFGLMEMSRQRIKANLGSLSKTVCETCNGLGTLRAVPIAGMAALRKATDYALNAGQNGEVRIEAPASVADYLLNEKRIAVQRIEQTFGISIRVMINPQILPGFEHFHVLNKKAIEDDEKKLAIAKERHERSQSKHSSADKRGKSKTIWKYKDGSIEAKDLPEAVQEILNESYYDVTNQKPPTPQPKEVSQPQAQQDQSRENNNNAGNNRRPIKKRIEQRNDDVIEYFKEDFTCIEEVNASTIVVEPTEEPIEIKTFEIFEAIQSQPEAVEAEQEPEKMEDINLQETIVLKKDNEPFKKKLIRPNNQNTRIQKNREDFQTIELEQNNEELNQDKDELDINDNANNQNNGQTKVNTVVTTTVDFEEEPEHPGLEFIHFNKASSSFGAGLIETTGAEDYDSPEESDDLEDDHREDDDLNDSDSDFASVIISDAKQNGEANLEATEEAFVDHNRNKNKNGRRRRRGNNRRGNFRKKP